MDLDHVIEAPDGTLAAFCLAWLDEENRAGLLEPVGRTPTTDDAGLATAVCLGALRALRGEGATVAVIGSVDPSPAETVYEGMGFTSVTRHVPYRKKSADEGA